jgi:hypothetical protein
MEQRVQEYVHVGGTVAQNLAAPGHGHALIDAAHLQG